MRVEVYPSLRRRISRRGWGWAGVLSIAAAIVFGGFAAKRPQFERPPVYLPVSLERGFWTNIFFAVSHAETYQVMLEFHPSAALPAGKLLEVATGHAAGIEVVWAIIQKGRILKQGNGSWLGAYGDSRRLGRIIGEFQGIPNVWVQIQFQVNRSIPNLKSAEPKLIVMRKVNPETGAAFGKVAIWMLAGLFGMLGLLSWVAFFRCPRKAAVA